MPDRVAALLEDRRKLERQVTELQKKLATGGGGEAVEEVNGVKLAARNLGEVPARDLKGLADAIGKQLGSGVVALVSTAEGKASIVVGVSPDLAGKVRRWSWCARRRRRWAARAAAGGPTWRRPAARTAQRPTKRWQRSGRLWRLKPATDSCVSDGHRRVGRVDKLLRRPPLFRGSPFRPPNASLPHGWTGAVSRGGNRRAAESQEADGAPLIRPTPCLDATLRGLPIAPAAHGDTSERY